MKIFYLVFISIFDVVRAGNKPGSVPLQHHQGSNSRTIQPISWLKRGAATIYLGLMLPSASSILPDRRAGHPKAILFGLAAGGVCTAGPVTRTAVGSYPAISPLPVASRRPIGGMFSVALSIGSHRLAVSQHPALCCPDFPPVRSRL